MAEQGAGQKTGAAARRPGYWRRLRTSGVTQFWTAFWLVIIGLAGLYGYAQWTIATKSARVAVDSTGQVKVSQDWAAEWQGVVNELTTMARVEIDGASREKINAAIDARIEDAFAPVYGQVPKFADFHYSIVGEYTELLAVLAGEGASSLQGILFDEVKFDARLDGAAKEIGNTFEGVIGEALDKLKGRLDAAPGLTPEERGLLSGALKLTVDDVKARFSGEMVAARTGGAAAVLIAAKKAATSLAEKVAAKAAIKAGAKVVTPGAAGVGGAAACSWLGPVGAGACGVGAAVVAWLATDAVIIAIDELYNRQEFEAEIRQLVDEQKASVKEGLKANYATLIDAISKDIDRKIQATTPAEAVKGK